MKAPKLSRRNMLRALGVSAAAWPLIPTLEREAEAAGGIAPRIVFFWSPNGLIRKHYTPGGSGQNFTLSDILSPLAPFKNKVTVVDGLDNSAAFEPENVGGDDGHVPTQVLSGQVSTSNSGAPGQTIDQFLADNLPSGLTFKSLAFASGSNGSQAEIFFHSKSDAVAPMMKPSSALTQLFAGVKPEDPAAELIRQQHLSILDGNTKRLQALKGKISAADQHKLDAHLQALNELEQSFSATTGCVPPTLDGQTFSDWTFESTGQQHMQLIAAAMACNLTRVATLQYHGAASEMSFDPIGVPDLHHKLAHYEGSGGHDAQDDKLRQVGTWYAKQLAYLVQRLDQIPEGNGTVLDNTIVVWVPEHGMPGNGMGVHGQLNLPFVMVGGGNTGLKTGQYLDFRSTQKGQYGELVGVPCNRLYLSLAHLLGLNSVTQFGASKFCADGPLTGLT